MAEYIIDTSELSGIDEEWLAKHEQIIRCKDCRYCKPYEAMKVEGYKCTRVSTCFGIDLDGFCKWGEITANGGDGEAVI